MDNQNKPRVIAADRIDGTLVITFDNGRSGKYSSEVLYAAFTQAEELFDDDGPDIDAP